MFDIVIWIIYLCSLYFPVFWLLVLIEKSLGADDLKEELADENLPSVSIIVPAYNEKLFIKDCINSLLNLDYPKEKLEIIVVNDGSTDNTREICEGFRDSINLINLERNSGKKAVPLNIGIRKANGEFVACLDGDSLVDSKSLRKMIPYFKDKEIAAVTPALKAWKPNKMIEKMQWFEYIFSILLRKAMSLIDCIYVAPGPFTVYRKDILLKLNGFDDKNITEDMEIALRLQSHHYRIENVVDANVYTHVPSDLKGLYTQRRRWYAGFLYNAMNYKSLFFDRRYGDFGILMPLNLLSVIVLISSTVLFMYYLIKPFWNELSNFYLINFDIFPYLKNITFDMVILDLDFAILFLSIIVFIIGILILVISHRFSSERITKQGLFSPVFFVLFYFIILGYFWIGISAELIRGIKKDW